MNSTCERDPEHALKPYPAYKDSGVDWLGYVPAHWDVRRLRTSVDGCVNGIWGDDPTGHHDLVCVRVADFDRESWRVDLTGQTVRSISMSERTRRLLKDGDLLLEKSGGGDLQPVGVVVMYTHRVPAVCSNFVARMPVSFGLSPKYLTYLHACLYSKRLNARSIKQTTGIQNLDSYSYLNERVAFPPLSEQVAIVRFLDHADRRIQRYIRAKQELVALLEEQKQAIIQQAVTGQIDVRTRQRYPTYKQTHVEGIRDVPEHWDVIALKRVLTNLIDCEHRTAPAVAQSKYNVVRTSAVRAGVLSWEGTYCTNSSAFAEWTRRGIPRFGDVIFTREAPAGEACLVPKARRVCLGQRTVLLRPDPTRYDSSFLIHMIYGGPPRVRVQLASQGSTVGHFNVDDIGWMPVLVPPLKEQQEIVAVLGSYNSKVERAQRCLERELRLFHEYRIRLIADVVTGKLDVREVACNLPATAPLSTGARNEVASTEPEAAATGRDNFNDLGHIGRNGDRTLVDT